MYTADIGCLQLLSSVYEDKQFAATKWVTLCNLDVVCHLL